jgi:hypothetical protein
MAGSSVSLGVGSVTTVGFKAFSDTGASPSLHEKSSKLPMIIKNIFLMMVGFYRLPKQSLFL